MRQDLMAMAIALALAGQGTTPASEPAATRESAQLPGDVRVLAIE